MDEVPSSGAAYAYSLLNRWDTMLVSYEEYLNAKNAFLLYGIKLPTAETAPSNLANALMMLWEELYPFVSEVETVPPTLRSKFMAFKKYQNKSHMLILNPHTGNEIFELKNVIGETLNVLGITKIPKPK